MGFFEWLGELFNPGPVGTVARSEADEWQPQSRFVVWLLTLAGLGLFIFLLVAILQSGNTWQWLLAFVVYLFLAWALSPLPDHRNMGWFGGLMDNPFRISDDANRLLLLFAVLLAPGKIMLYALQTVLNTIRARG